MGGLGIRWGCWLGPDHDRLQFRKQVSEHPEGGKIITGYLPVYDLNVFPKDAKDSWNHYIQYSVTLDLTLEENYDQRGGKISIVDENQSEITWNLGYAQYVIMSHGSNGCQDESPDQVNCADASKFLIMPYNAAKDSFFDDIVIYDEFVQEPDNYIKKSCSVDAFLLSRNVKITNDDIPINLSYIQDGKFLRICNKKILTGLGYPEDKCHIFLCNNGELTNAEKVLD